MVYHPKYLAADDIFDIGLVQTKIRLIWNRGVGPACLPFLYEYVGRSTYTKSDFSITFVLNYLSNYDFATRVVTATGWGTKWFGGPIAEILQKVDLTIITNTQCAKAYNNTAILASHVCTTSMGYDACQVTEAMIIWPI